MSVNDERAPRWDRLVLFPDDGAVVEFQGKEIVGAPVPPKHKRELPPVSNE